MSDLSAISRRSALVAAVSLGASAAVADDSPFEQETSETAKPRRPVIPIQQVKLSITLTDGQVVSFNATQAVIDFGTGSQLLVKSTGVMPIITAGPPVFTPDPVPNRRRDVD
jgi:hypothetical protein